jgi:hypothetical protein
LDGADRPSAGSKGEAKGMFARATNLSLREDENRKEVEAKEIIGRKRRRECA